MKRLSVNEIRLCGKGKCCPIITKIDEDTYEVLDDYGNKIKVKREELAMVTDAIKELDKPLNEQLILG